MDLAVEDRPASLTSLRALDRGTISGSDATILNAPGRIGRRNRVRRNMSRPSVQESVGVGPRQRNRRKDPGKPDSSTVRSNNFQVRLEERRARRKAEQEKVKQMQEAIQVEEPPGDDNGGAAEEADDIELLKGGRVGSAESTDEGIHSTADNEEEQGDPSAGEEEENPEDENDEGHGSIGDNEPSMKDAISDGLAADLEDSGAVSINEDPLGDIYILDGDAPSAADDDAEEEDHAETEEAGENDPEDEEANAEASDEPEAAAEEADDTEAVADEPEVADEEQEEAQDEPDAEAEGGATESEELITEAAEDNEAADEPEVTVYGGDVEPEEPKNDSGDNEDESVPATEEALSEEQTEIEPEAEEFSPVDNTESEENAVGEAAAEETNDKPEIADSNIKSNAPKGGVRSFFKNKNAGQRVSIFQRQIVGPVSQKRNAAPQAKSSLAGERRRRPRPQKKEVADTGNAGVDVESPQSDGLNSMPEATETHDSDQPSNNRRYFHPVEKRVQDFLSESQADLHSRRPKAPHKRVQVQLPEEESPPATDNDKEHTGVEVWVPEEDKVYVYMHSSKPRVLQMKSGGTQRVTSLSHWDNDPNSAFRLKLRRSHRGSRDLTDLPKWNPYFTNARSLSPENQQQSYGYDMQQPEVRRAEFREKLEARARLRRDKHGLSNLYSSNASSVNRLTLRLDGPSGNQWGSQTEGRAARGPNRVLRSAPGVDAQTQVYQDELEAAGEAAMEEVLLGTLVARTLRESVLEVVLEEQADESRTTRILQEVTVAQEKNSSKEEEETREDPDGKEPSEVDAEGEAPAEDDAPAEDEAPAGEEEAPDEEEAPGEEDAPDGEAEGEGEADEPAEGEAAAKDEDAEEKTED